MQTISIQSNLITPLYRFAETTNIKYGESTYGNNAYSGTVSTQEQTDTGNFPGGLADTGTGVLIAMIAAGVLVFSIILARFLKRSSPAE